MALTEEAGGLGGVARELSRARPAAAPGRAAEAALVIGVGGNAGGGPSGAGRGKGVGVIVEAVERQDHRAGLAAREPAAERQRRAVGGDEGVGHERRAGGGERRRDGWPGGELPGRRGGDTAGKKHGEA